MWGQTDGIAASRSTPNQGWDTPVLISTQGGGGGVAKVAFDPKGNAIAVWEESADGVWSNRYTPSQGWGTAVRVASNAGVSDMSIASNGIATAVLTVPEGVAATRYIPEHGWTDVVVIGGSNELDPSRFPRVAADTNGNAVAVWSQSDGTVYSVWANRFE